MFGSLEERTCIYVAGIYHDDSYPKGIYGHLHKWLCSDRETTQTFWRLLNIETVLTLTLWNIKYHSNSPFQGESLQGQGNKWRPD